MKTVADTNVPDIKKSWFFYSKLSKAFKRSFDSPKWCEKDG